MSFPHNTHIACVSAAEAIDAAGVILTHQLCMQMITQLIAKKRQLKVLQQPYYSMTTQWQASDITNITILQYSTIGADSIHNNSRMKQAVQPVWKAGLEAFWQHDITK